MKPDLLKPDPALIDRLDQLLEQIYGVHRYTGSLLLGQVDKDPLDVLVATLLSQATTDRASGMAFRRLRQRFPKWEAVLKASPEEVEKLIGDAGLHRQKALRLFSILGAVKRRAGAVSLDFLRSEDTESARRFLEGLPGVGPKTAACVLLFGLGRPAFPVDTHVHRVAKRLGLVPEKADRVRAQKLLQEVVPSTAYFRLHVNLIAHGRAVCQARRPRCPECPLQPFCPSAVLPGPGAPLPGPEPAPPDGDRRRSPGGLALSERQPSGRARNEGKAT